MAEWFVFCFTAIVYCRFCLSINIPLWGSSDLNFALIRWSLGGLMSYYLYDPPVSPLTGTRMALIPYWLFIHGWVYHRPPTFIKYYGCVIHLDYVVNLTPMTIAIGASPTINLTTTVLPAMTLIKMCHSSQMIIRVWELYAGVSPTDDYWWRCVITTRLLIKVGQHLVGHASTQRPVFLWRYLQFHNLINGETGRTWGQVIRVIRNRIYKIGTYSKWIASLSLRFSTVQLYSLYSQWKKPTQPHLQLWPNPQTYKVSSSDLYLILFTDFYLFYLFSGLDTWTQPSVPSPSQNISCPRPTFHVFAKYPSQSTPQSQVTIAKSLRNLIFKPNSTRFSSFVTTTEVLEGPNDDWIT